MSKKIKKNISSSFIDKYPLLFKKYKPLKKIANGAISELYSGINIHNNENVAIKIEKRNIMNKLLESECYLLFSLKSVGIPKVLSFGHNKEYDILIMPLLGKTLLDIFISKNLNFEFKDVCLIAIQIIERIQLVHYKKIIHRDIKPDNFLIGLKDPHIIYLIDFGLSKKYQSSTSGKHIKFSKVKKFTGTTLFGSVNALMLREQSRRDDLESIGYMLIYFMKGRLPWQGIKVDNKKETYLKISELKKNITPEKLCENLPYEFVDYIKYVKNLKFEENPNYSYLRNLFVQMLKKQGFEEGKCFFSWINLNNVNLRYINSQINMYRISSSRKRIMNKIKKNLENSKRSLSEKKNEYFSALGDSAKKYIDSHFDTNENDNTYNKEEINKFYINPDIYKYINEQNINQAKLISSDLKNTILKANPNLNSSNTENNYRNIFCINPLSLANKNFDQKSKKILLNSFSSEMQKEQNKSYLFPSKNTNYIRNTTYCLNNCKNKINNNNNKNNINKNSNNNKKNNCIYYLKKNPNNKNKSLLIMPNNSCQKNSQINNFQTQKNILMNKNYINKSNKDSFMNKNNNNNNIYIINNNIYTSNNLSYNKENNTFFDLKKKLNKKDNLKDINDNFILESQNKNNIKLFNIFSPIKKTFKNKQNITLQPNSKKEILSNNSNLMNEIKEFNQRYNNIQFMDNNKKQKKIKIPKTKLTSQSNNNNYKNLINKVNNKKKNF